VLQLSGAALAVMADLDLATENRGDFESIAQALEMLFPRAEPLVVVGPLV